MARAARAAGAEIVCEAGVREVIVEKDRAAGVILDNGETVRAQYVAASVNPKLLYMRLIPPQALPDAFLARIARWRNGSGTFRINVALSALPSFTALPGDGDHLTAGSSSPRASATWTRPGAMPAQRGWSREPIVEVLIPSTLDNSLAPAGRACREPVLPARRAGTARWKILG